jgi:MoaA/NifB/PqqE/SkfB family radical SAM enzyme
MIRLDHLKMISRYLARRFRKLHPFEVEAALLNECNLHCLYCRYPDRLKPQMTTQQWKDIIRGFASLGTLRFKLHGGEPTLRPDFRQLTREVKDAGMIAAATTNGSRIANRPELLDYLRELIVSLDSPHGEVNDRIRGKGSYKLAVKTIDLARRHGLRTYVNMVLTRVNLGDLEEMLAFCEARSVTLNAQPLVCGGLYYIEAGQPLSLSPGEIREAGELMIRWKKQGRRLIFSKWAYKKVLDWPDYSLASRKGRGVSPCVAGKDYIRVECNGDVLPCCQYTADFVPKNILRHGLVPSLLHVRTHNCRDCWLAYYNERQALFKLKPGAVWEAVKRI